MLAIVASNFNTMTRWSERRGVADDLCYLRQAHLFQKQGWRGLDSNILSETDGYFGRIVSEAGHPEWNTPANSICHIDMAATGKRVIQYPPGIGFLLAAFPEGFQVVPLYAMATILVWLMALIALGCARDRPSALGAFAFGCLALYFMINPSKASYSMAPTMVVCALSGWLTALLFTSQTTRARATTLAALGLVIGLSVTVRIPNLLLAAGYGFFLLAAFAATRIARTFLEGVLFGAASLIGLVPTLVYNTINAGHPLSTTYGGADLSSPAIDLGVIAQYARDIQGFLIVSAVAWTIRRLGRKNGGLQSVAFITAVNLVVNLGFFLTHPIFQQYYLMPLAMLSLWTLLFDALMTSNAASSRFAASAPA